MCAVKYSSLYLERVYSLSYLFLDVHFFPRCTSRSLFNDFFQRSEAYLFDEVGVRQEHEGDAKITPEICLQLYM